MSVETCQTEMQRGKTEQSIPELWDGYKRLNVHVMGIPEGKERESNRRNI